MNIKDIDWSEEIKPCETNHYDHVIGVTPLGNFVITWKSWKESKSFDVDESPFGWLGSEYTLDDAKELAKKEYENKVIECLDLATHKVQETT